MNDDEQAIRSLVATWMQATAAGDLDRVLELMADDVVFLGAGRPPMRGKAEFAAATRAAEGKGRIEGSAEIQEIEVSGVLLFAWTSDFRPQTSNFRLLAFQQPASALREADRRTPVESSAP